MLRTLAALFFSFGLAAAARSNPDSFVLTCPLRTQPGGEYVFLLELSKRQMWMLLPSGQKVVRYDIQVEPNRLVHRMVHEGKVIMEITINRWTLELSVVSELARAFGMNTHNSGRCIMNQKRF